MALRSRGGGHKKGDQQQRDKSHGKRSGERKNNKCVKRSHQPRGRITLLTRTKQKKTHVSVNANFRLVPHSHRASTQRVDGGNNVGYGNTHEQSAFIALGVRAGANSVVQSLTTRTARRRSGHARIVACTRRFAITGILNSRCRARSVWSAVVVVHVSKTKEALKSMCVLTRWIWAV